MSLMLEALDRPQPVAPTPSAAGPLESPVDRAPPTTNPTPGVASRQSNGLSDSTDNTSTDDGRAKRRKIILAASVSVLALGTGAGYTVWQNRSFFFPALSARTPVTTSGAAVAVPGAVAVVPEAGGPAAAGQDTPKGDKASGSAAAGNKASSPGASPAAPATTSGNGAAAQGAGPAAESTAANNKAATAAKARPGRVASPPAADAAAAATTTATAAATPTTPVPSNGETAAPARPGAGSTAGTSAPARTAVPGGNTRSATPPRGADGVQMQRATTADTSAAAWQKAASGEFGESLAQYRRVLARHPDDLDALVGAATLLHRAGDREAAHTLYRRALAVKPNHAAAVGGMLQLLGDVDAATAESRLKEFIDSQGGDDTAYAALGQLLARQNRWSEAQASLFQAHALRPERAAHAYNLAVALDRLHQTRQAVEYYRLALSLPQNGEVPVAAARQRLDKLQPPAQGQPAPRETPSASETPVAAGTAPAGAANP